ncbi:MAG: hypothetical protein A2W91_15170 [Bacteroidetes bacterium GWF2_38_335]|nr:MAG: hypothetical protein A2W91_15170 [Bacteroidetes bacterium GWF2_38_335]OFY81079.1 MAG: hypothetical protein A2281_13310 [Bacteroidetes bacterium RIFOXYA12_FULL_38_20]HBS87602.1 DUF58 domain-containing protein [Bacteroidales bacterium]
MKNLNDIQQIQQFKNLEFVAKQVVEGFITGLHRSPFHGFSVEFAEHRIYNSGESTKHIDWKLYARTEKLFTKRFEEETNLRSYLVIDRSSSMLFPYNEKSVFNKLFFSVYCAASMIYLLRKQRDAVGLSIFSDKIDLYTRSRLSNVHAQILFTELEKLLNPTAEDLNRQTSAAEALHEIAEKTHKRSLIVVFSDMFDGGDKENLYSALQHLRYKKHEVILFHVTDHKLEENFEYHHRPYKFIDLESGKELKLNPNEIKEKFRETYSKYKSEIKLKCAQYAIDLVEADINKDFSEVLMAYMIKRASLY